MHPRPSCTRIQWSLWLFLTATGLFASEGKIRGTVTDKATGMPVIQAEVSVANYTLKAVTDLNGEYILLDVPVGTHTLIVRHADFGEIQFTGVIVRSSLTTYQDLVLSGDEQTIQADPVRIEKDETGDIQTFRGKEIERMPLREVGDVLSMMAGVVYLDDQFHIRGGRHDELGWVMDGFNVSDVFDGKSMIPVIPNAIEQVTLRPGNFSAEYGGKMSGMAEITLKTGSPQYNITGEMISDDFWAVKDERGSYEILGIDKLYSYGYNDYVLTAGGPLIPGYRNLRFFAAAQGYNRLSDAAWFEGFHQDSIQMISRTTTWHNEQLTDTAILYVDQPPGRLPGGGSGGLTVQGNLLWDFKPFRIKVGGTWSQARSTPQTRDPRGIYTIGTRDTRYHYGNYNGYFNVTHTINPTMFYTLAGSYSQKNNEYGDPLMGWDKDSWIDWGDPTKNPTLVDTSQAWSNYLLPFNPNFAVGYPGTPVQYYHKEKEEKTTLKFDFTKQFGKRHEVKVGGEYSMSKYRSFSFNARGYLRRLRDVGLDPDSYSEWDIYSPLLDQCIGYDWFGNEIEEDMIVETRLGLSKPVDINLRNAPPKPKYAGLYVQDRIELKNVVINLGIRLDHFNNGVPSLNNLAYICQVPAGVNADTCWRDPKTYTYFNPRLGFSFPVMDKTVFHAQFGQFVQAPSLQQTWTFRKPVFMELLYSGVYFSPYSNPNLKPVRATFYEFGFQMQFGAYAFLDATVFYKEMTDLSTYRVIIPEIPDYSTPTFFMNGDFGTSKGVTAHMIFRSNACFQIHLLYTCSDTKGTGSTGGEHFAIAWNEENPHFPDVMYPLSFDVRHKGTFLLDFQTLPEQGPRILGFHPLGNIGLNLKCDFQSGRRYTRIPVGDAFSELYGYNAPPPLEAHNSSSFPWFFQLDGKLDKSFHIGPVEFNVYLWVINILGTRGIINGFRQTGKPDTDGWFETDAGKEKIAEMGAYADDWKKWYTAVITGCGTFGYQQPRQVRMGVKFEI